MFLWIAIFKSLQISPSDLLYIRCSSSCVLCFRVRGSSSHIIERSKQRVSCGWWRVFSCSGFLPAARSAEAVYNSPGMPLTSVVQCERPASIRPPCGARDEFEPPPPPLPLPVCAVGPHSRQCCHRVGDVTGWHPLCSTCLMKLKLIIDR